jgi:hypothetical protein
MNRKFEILDQFLVIVEPHVDVVRYDNFQFFPDFPRRAIFHEKIPKGKVVPNRVRHLHRKYKKNRQSRFRENSRPLNFPQFLPTKSFFLFSTREKNFKKS